jgi:hypothetical protein
METGPRHSLRTTQHSCLDLVGIFNGYSLSICLPGILPILGQSSTGVNPILIFEQRTV